MNQQPLTIRSLAADDEMHTCERLQKAVWQSSDLEVVPHHIFVVAPKIGGQVFGAFEESAMAGFALAFPALRDGRPYLHSHMTAVLPERQNLGIGRELKLAQRANALERAVDLIEWTFDPLQLRNAHFNIVRLGAIVRHYLPDFYGRTSSALDAGLPTDRLLAQWWIREPRVEEILAGQPLRHSGELRRICLPRRIREICYENPEQAREIQVRLRMEFEHLLSDSFAVTGFELADDHAAYILERYEN